jgi:hypothetical protein
VIFSLNDGWALAGKERPDDASIHCRVQSVHFLFKDTLNIHKTCLLHIGLLLICVLMIHPPNYFILTSSRFSSLARPQR